ncbi:MAG TPA: OB-fold nucleic acid binding domain-containing protein, partial [Planctomicrobium sp.]|nr:OB-fold nucleic acid binding domain-containing protein [Planctomicrobium sp.]
SDGDSGAAMIPPADDWPQSQQLAYEKEVFGFYLTSHPLTQYADQIEAMTQQTTKDLRDLGDGKEVLLGGMITSIKKATTKNPSRNGNSKYVNFDLEDSAGVVRCIMWPDDFANAGEKVVADNVVLVKGRIDSRGREPNVIVNRLLTMSDAEKEFTKQIAVILKRGYHSEEDMKRIRDILTRYPGKTPIVVVAETVEEVKSPSSESVETGELALIGRRLRAFLSTPITVSARPELKQELESTLGESGYRFIAAPPSGGNGNSH